MPHLLDEIEANFDAFSAQWKKELAETSAELEKNRSRYLTSYARLASLNCWREELLSRLISTESLAFLLEAQNDALISHVLSSIGSWRSALKSLRSSIENVLYCCYFKDHPVELQLWTAGRFKPSFSELMDYFSKHPRVCSLPRNLSGLELIGQEYSTLSRAVHGAITFRMTAGDDSTTLWSSDIKNLAGWAKREFMTLAGLNLLLLALFSEQLRGAGHRSLRTALGLTIPKNRHAGIKAKLHVSLPTPT